MTINVATAQQVAEEVTRLAESDPDFIYTEQKNRPSDADSCGYGGWEIAATEGRPCIIGQALINVGADREELSKYAGTVNGNANEFFKGFDFENVEDLTTLGFLSEVQQRQDQGKSWGDALTEARELTL